MCMALDKLVISLILNEWSNSYFSKSDINYRSKI